jgi:Glycosyl transferases group 1
VVAGGDHPQASGYIESMKRQHAGNSRIEFRGYVPESDLADLFQSATVAVMPYSSSTGCSGVAHLACAFGVPIVSSDLADFRQMGQSEELAIDFYPPGKARGLADCLFDLLNNLDKQMSMATQNFSAALRMTMPNVVQKYLRHFELQQRVQTLRHISRFRRLPRWIPSKALLLRLMTHNSLSWARRSVVLHAPLTDISPAALLNSHNNGSRQLHGTGFPTDSHDIALRGHSSNGNGNGASARHTPQNRNGNGTAGKGSHDGTPRFAGQEEASNAKSQKTLGESAIAPLFVVRRGAAGDTSERENRMPGPIAGNNGVGSE